MFFYNFITNYLLETCKNHLVREDSVHLNSAISAFSTTFYVNSFLYQVVKFLHDSIGL